MGYEGMLFPPRRCHTFSRPECLMKQQNSDRTCMRVHSMFTGLPSDVSWLYRPPRPLGLASRKQLTQGVRPTALPCCRHVTAATSK